MVEAASIAHRLPVGVPAPEGGRGGGAVGATGSLPLRRRLHKDAISSR